MAVRFRIRTSAGQELSFASPEMFEDFVRSGDLSPDDLVYDADTESWSPARTHPLVLDIEYTDEDEDPDAGGDEASASDEEGLPRAGASSSETLPSGPTEEVREDDPALTLPGGSDFGLDLAPPADPVQQREAQAFVDRMEAERQAVIDRDVVPSRRTAADDVPLGEVAALGDTLAPRPDRSADRRERRDRHPDPVEAPVPRHVPESTPAAPGKSRALVGLACLAFVVVALGGAGGYAGFRLVNAAPPEGPPVDPSTPVEAIAVEPSPPMPRPAPLIESTPLAVSERATERFLTATRHEMRNLPPIPEVWPSGRYLALPSEYPLVVDVWQTYLSTLRALRAGDIERYRVAYEAALDDAHVEDESRGPRLARAMADFAARAAARDAHYDRAETLAIAAIQSHNALIEAEGLILFDENAPSDPPGALGAGTTSRDEESRHLLDEILLLLSESLDADGLGPGSPANVRAWVWDGFLDSVTS